MRRVIFNIYNENNEYSGQGRARGKAIDATIKALKYSGYRVEIIADNDTEEMQDENGDREDLKQPKTAKEN